MNNSFIIFLKKIPTAFKTDTTAMKFLKYAAMLFGYKLFSSSKTGNFMVITVALRKPDTYW